MSAPGTEPVTRSLGRSAPWGGFAVDGGAAAGVGPMVLAANPAGPLALTAEGDTLGALVPPRGFAVDDDLRVYWLRDGQLYRLEPAAEPGESAFELLLPPVGSAASSDAPREFSGAPGVAAAGALLAVADTGNRRVQVFDRRTLALRTILTFEAPPVDVAGRGAALYILTETGLFWFRPGDTTARPVPMEVFEGPYDRVALDSAGRVYLRPRGGNTLDVFDPRTGAALPVVRDAGEVRVRFAAPLVLRAEYRVGAAPGSVRLLVVAASLNRSVGRVIPERSPVPGAVLAPGFADVFLFDNAGRPVVLTEPAVPVAAPYRTSGVWVSGALDSGTYQCVWDRLDLEATAPAGTEVEVATLAGDDSDVAPTASALAPVSWAAAGTLASGAAHGESAQPTRPVPGATDFLLGGAPGRYLRVRVKLTGDGYASPSVRGIDVRGPRDSFLRYLPPVFAADEEGRAFLERFLAIFQAEWEPLERWAETTWRLFDPRTVPDDRGLLDDLGAVLGAALPTAWTNEQRRRVLSAAPGLGAFSPDENKRPGASRRGTVEGLRDLLRIYLWNETGHSVERLAAYPVVTEGFRERPAARVGAVLDEPNAPGVAGENELGRVILDETRLGTAELVSPGVPATDPVDRRAFRFAVYVPDAWVPTAEAERRFREAIDAEKPAHTAYELHTVPARLRVGEQSTVGVDTIIGSLALGALPAELNAGAVLPPVGAPGPGLVLDPANRVGLESTIT